MSGQPAATSSHRLTAPDCNQVGVIAQIGLTTSALTAASNLTAPSPDEAATSAKVAEKEN